MQNQEYLIHLLEIVNHIDKSPEKDARSLEYFITWLKIHSILQINYKTDNHFKKLDVKDQKTIKNLLNKFREDIIPDLQIYITQLKKLQQAKLNNLFLSYFMDYVNRSEQNIEANPELSSETLTDSLFFLSIFQLVVAPSMIKIARSKIFDKMASLPQVSKNPKDIFLPNVATIISNEPISQTTELHSTPIKFFFNRVGSDINKWFAVQKNNTAHFQKKIEERSSQFVKSIETHLNQTKQTIKSKQMEWKKKRVERKKTIQLNLQQREQQRDQDLLFQFKNIMRISQQIKRNDVARALSIPETELLQRLIQWGDQYPFKIDKDIIIVEDLSKFVSVLDNQFEEWDKYEQLNDGKI